MDYSEHFEKKAINWVTLETVCDLVLGNSKYTKNYIQNHPGIYPVYSSATSNEGSIGAIATYDYNGEYLTWTTDGYPGHVFYRNGKFNITNHAGLIKIKNDGIVDIHYLHHVLKVILPKHVNHDMPIPRLAVKTAQTIKIPLIPIEQQRQIGNFLKNLTELVTELERRKMQYAYYQKQLLNFAAWQDAKWVKVADLCTIKVGESKYSKSYIKEHAGQYPVYSAQVTNGGIMGYIDSYDYDGEYLTWTAGGYPGHVFYRNGKFNITADSGLLTIKKTDHINIHYLYHVLKMIAPKHANYHMPLPKLPMKTMAHIKLPLIPIHQQIQIATILNNFEKLVNDLNFGLPSEIAFREQQYRYYQKQLLHFAT